jgi:hypothetical protein
MAHLATGGSRPVLYILPGLETSKCPNWIQSQAQARAGVSPNRSLIVNFANPIGVLERDRWAEVRGTPRLATQTPRPNAFWIVDNVYKPLAIGAGAGAPKLHSCVLA